MHVALFSLLMLSTPYRLPYIQGQSKEVRTCGSPISNLDSLDILPRRVLRGGCDSQRQRVEGDPQLIQWRRILLQASSIQPFLSSKIGFKLFQATHAHGLSNNQVIKWYLRLELRGTCPLLRFPSSSFHLHLVYPISMANQREFELLQVQSQNLRAQTSSVEED